MVSIKAPKSYPQPARLLHWKKVQNIVPISRTTAWRLEKSGLFPRRRQLMGTRNVVWVESEILDWLASHQPAIE